MKTRSTSVIAKTIFVIALAFTAMIGYSQCTVITPGPVSGIKNVCPYVGTLQQLTYTIDPVPGATSYEWLVPPANCTLVSGQGTTSIVMTFQTGYIFQANKQIRVRALFPCGVSSYYIFYTLAQFPNASGPIIQSTADVCAYIGTLNTVSYSVSPALSATHYVWEVPPGCIITAHPSGDGVNDTIINVIFQSGFAGGNICVTGVNDCGINNRRCFYVAANAPAPPGQINGTTNVCENMGPAGIPETYSVAPITGALSFTWTTPPNCIVTHPNGTGPNDNVINVLFPAGFTDGQITVTVTTACGTSTPKNINLTRLLPSAPGGISAVDVLTCPDRVITYSIPAMSLHSTSAEWTVPPGATIMNGQGTTSITVSYPATAIIGNVTVTGVSNCGVSVPRTLGVSLGQCNPFTAGNQTGNTTTVNTAKDKIALQVSPNPSTSNFKVKVLTNDKTNVNVRILDISGRVLKNIVATQNEIISFGDDLKPGAYMIEVTQGNKKEIQKLVRF